MSDFEKWFKDQGFYTNMRFIHGDKLFDKDGDVYRVLPVQMVYQGWNTQRQRSKEEFVTLTQEWHTKGWNARQGEIDQLKAQLNNMEQCYIQLKQINNEQAEIIRGHFSARQEMKKCIDAALYDIAQAKDGFYGYSSDGGDVDNLTKNIEKSLRGER